PVVRLSNNQVVGFIEISRDRNPDLRDQTNREGLLHNESFVDLRRFLHVVLEILEAARQAVRHPDNAPRALAETNRRNGHGPTLRPGPAAGLPAAHARGWSELAAAGQAATLVSRASLPVLGEIHAGLDHLRQMTNGSGTGASRRLMARLESQLRDLGSR